MNAINQLKACIKESSSPSVACMQAILVYIEQLKRDGLAYLQEKEWSAGCGQCPECLSVSEKWLGHPLYLNSKELGHKANCKLARLIKTIGGNPLYQGDSQLSDIYEFYWDSNGFGSTRKVSL